MSTTAVPSKMPEDFALNIENLDKFTNSTSSTFTDRLGGVKKTIVGVLAEYPNASGNAAASEASRQASAAQAGISTTQAGLAAAARTGAELYAGIAFGAVNIKTSTAQGITDTTPAGNKFFSVISPVDIESVIVYENVGGVATERKRLANANRVAAIYTKEQDTLAAQSYDERFTFLDLAAQTYVNLTDAAVPTVTKTKVANGLQIALTTGSRDIAFSTGSKVGAGKRRIRYRAECTFATTCFCGFSLFDGVTRRVFTLTQDGRFNDSVLGLLSLTLPAFTTGAIVEMEAVIDTDAKTMKLSASVNGGAPFAFNLSAVPLGNVELVQRGSSTVIHSLKLETIGAFANSAFKVAATPEITAIDRNILNASVGFLKTLRRNTPTGWAYPVPNSYRFYQNGGAYFSGIDLRPILSEDDPEVTVLYVDVATGSDAAAGTATAPLKGLKAAGQRVGLGGKVIIKAKGGLYSYDHAFGGVVGGIGSILQVVSWDGLPVISSRHDTALTWALGTNATYSAAFTAGISGIFDASLLTSEGDYTRVTPVATLAACEATAGTYFLTGTTAYVHTFDGRAPDANVRVYKKALSGESDNYGLLFSKHDQTAYLENIHFEGGVLPLTLDTRTGNYRQKLFAKNCTMKYAGGGNGLNQTSDALIVLQNCVAAWNSQDGFNYKSSNFGGAAPLAIEIDCIGRWNGYDAEGTNNGSTMHSGGSVIRVNGLYFKNQNRNVHDITNAFSWNLGCEARDSQNLGQPGNFCAGVGLGDATVMWLDGCKSSGSTFGLEASVASTIYTSNLTNTSGVRPSGGLVTTYAPV